MKPEFIVRQVERALLVSVFLREGSDGWAPEDEAAELRELTTASGVEVAAEVVARRDRPTAALLLGKGKIDEIAQACLQHRVDVVIFNRDLSPAQLNNIAAVVKVKTIDRTQLILDIFAQRAHSQEGKLQVELAQLRYRLPRLTGLGEKLSQPGGGVGTRGPGEKMLETDRRHVRRRILRVERDLRDVEQHRCLVRQGRHETRLPTLALVGYTNAGKTTLFNRLANDQQLAANQLFSTLDPVSRRLVLPNHQAILLYDTVGFLHRLPHHLVEAFKATLEEVVQADALLHVLDASHPLALQQAEAVEQVLKELRASEKPVVTVLNKVDRIEPGTVRDLMRRFDDAVAISATTGKGVETLLSRLVSRFAEAMVMVQVRIPMNQTRLVHILHQQGQVREERYDESSVVVDALVPNALRHQLISRLGPSAVTP